MVAFTVLSQELLCVIYFLIFHSRGDIGRLQRILGEAALSTPHSDAIFSFVLHEMECLIRVSLTHPVLCLWFCQTRFVMFQESKGNFSPQRKTEVKSPTQTNIIRHHKVTFLFVLGNYLL